jgi:drug/metabolite transporter (DMT)-like permease/nitroimidazol reductase NimA-like FMN-containing flavoprotein (pyridoxamine 5'-phosphate oxidase superfamily)
MSMSRTRTGPALPLKAGSGQPQPPASSPSHDASHPPRVESAQARPEAPTLPQLALAFTAIYLIWGSTYYAILVAIETMPPFLMTGARFFIAGAILVAWKARSAQGPVTGAHWRSAARIGGLMMAGGTGLVALAEQWVPSGVAALLIVTVPMWMVWVDWLAYAGPRPTGRIVLGLVLGIAGVAMLIGPGEILAAPVPPLGAAIIVFAALLWSIGSLESRHATAPAGSPLLTVGMRMLAAGAILMVVGTLTGEWARVDLAAVSARSWLAFGYLIFFGSIIAFSAYYWLLRVAAPSAVATYAFVNPVVAIGLGWALAGEPIGWNTVVAAALIIGAVAMITLRRGTAPLPRTPSPKTAGGGGALVGPELTRIRQHPERASYDRTAIDAILDEGLVCHVGVVVDGRPVVIPMAYARDGERLLLHGGRTSRLIQALVDGAPACVTVTHLDGLVLARSTLQHSMNYRSVVVMGCGAEITETEAKRAALDAIVEHLIPGRSTEVRQPSPKEVDTTVVVAIPLDAASAKMRFGPPKDAPEDVDPAVWAGVLPLSLAAGAPVAGPDVAPALPVAASVAGWRGVVRS